MIRRHLIETPDGPREIPPVVFVHEGGGPHRSCDACLAVVESNGDLVHAGGCGPALTRLAADAARGSNGPLSPERYRVLCAAMERHLAPADINDFSMNIKIGLLLQRSERERWDLDDDPIKRADHAMLRESESALRSAEPVAIE